MFQLNSHVHRIAVKNTSANVVIIYPITCERIIGFSVL